MELVNEFRVAVPIDKAWTVLTDVERIAPCIPGAQLLSVDGDAFTGAVKVKVGPITVQYQGNAEFKEKDDNAHRAVIKAVGKETRGQGNAAAVVTAELKDEGDSTACVLTTDLTISGKAAQFGRGVLADVAGKLIGQFAERLEADLLSGGAAPASAEPAAASAASPAAVQAPTQEAASLDLFSVIAAPLAKRALPVAAGLAAGLLIGSLFGGRRKPYVIVVPTSAGA
ncbi:SRPBCC family protein [Mycolicibacterium mengxianglii]|uniref:SRPBCC family protein n=1 Tax=Mycolicibacterium mengxianglii TaxID=2736649 RepID=UPI0018D0A9D0|nr:SRPBCC family protein [Mycolicibacterium mengxianglii]